ncbi:hypothetical protein [Pantoea rwandensis]|uniref:Uncharacterized protein n=1 Tax=Pantoea rwandensis TaxID=1076550 RepID=A0A1X1D587_9GAMM|nr:hypothetical protein [Pantoea rwandensis]ORM71845.1 hypothetical protein HA51_01910 [Pantoea rwandensis]
MTDYCFFTKDNQTVALEKSDVDGAAQLTNLGYKQQFEEVSASNKQRALSRFNDICKEKRIDQHNFRAGAFAFPLIGVLTVVAGWFFRKK